MSQVSSETGPAAFGAMGREKQTSAQSGSQTDAMADNRTDDESRPTAGALAVRDDDSANTKKSKRGKTRRRQWVGPFGWAFILTVAWVGLWAGYIYAYGEEIPVLSTFPSAWIAAMLVGIFVPAGFVWMLAVVVAQSAKLKRSADAMRLMADRLTRPEESAVAEISTIGAAVERQIDKISHALDAATTRVEKMETTLEKKVAALDEAGRRARAQTNDIKMELEGERQSLGSFADKLHKDMGENVAAFEGRLSDLTNTATQAQNEIRRTEEMVKSHMDAFQEAMENMSSGSETAIVELGRQHDKLHNVADVVVQRSDEVVQKYEQKRSDLDTMVRKLEGQGTFLDGAVTRQRDFLSRMSEVLADQSVQLDEALGQARDKFEEAFAAMMARAGDAGDKFRTETERSLIDSEKAADAIKRSGEAAALAFKSKANEAISDSDEAAAQFMLRAAELNKKIRVEASTVIEIGEDTAKAIREALSTANQVAEDVRRSMHEQAEAINKSVGDSTVAAEAASEKLTSRIRDSKSSAEELVTHLDKALVALGDAGNRLNRTVDVVEGQSGKLKDQLEELSQDVEARIAKIPDTASAEAARMRDMFGSEIGQMSALAQSVTEEAEKLQRAIQERRQLLIDMHMGVMDEEARDDSPLTPDAEPIREDHSQDDEEFLGVFKRGQWSSADDDASNAQEDSLPWPADDLPPPPASPEASPPKGPPRNRPLGRRQNALPERGFWQTLFTRIEEEKEAEEAEQRLPETSRSSLQTSTFGDDAFQAASEAIVGNLQAMAIDIDHLLEDTPPIELWQRYQHGEKNVFANRLLSLRTTGLTERIEQKYREDLEFRENADRYVRQFERLLDEAITRDRDNQLADSYLASQTGKVYLLLGQSIGYFG